MRGVVTRTVSYYGVAGAMWIDGTLYYVLTDQLGSASVVTDNSGAVVAGPDASSHLPCNCRMAPGSARRPATPAR